MELYEFKKTITKEFGSGLENATPRNVREFLDRMQFGALGPHMKGRIVLEESASSYEEVLKDFFFRVLDLPKDEALTLLWLLAFDFAFSAIELQHNDRFKSLFAEFDE